MKKHLLGSLLALGIITPFFANAAPSGWVLGQSVSSSNWISNAGCVSVINSSSCDYTGPSKALRLGYEYEFADEFWAGDRDRKLKNFCYEFKEPSSNGNYNQNKDGSGGENPTFNWTDELKNNVKEGVGYRVNKNTNMVILKANKIYQINAVPQTRSSDNLLVKYVVEYANDKAATTRYQHTECYPYEISRCGDGVVDKDWFKKNPNKPGEECDYKDPNKTGWEDGSGKRCNKSCELEEILPVCSSTYNNKTEYTSSSDQWLKATDNLCDEGSAVFFAYSGTPRVYKWKCKNGEKTTDDFCTAKQERCGDGVVQEDKEDCDDGENNGKSGSLCSKTCKTVGDVSCGTNDKGKTYFDEKQTKPWLTKTSAGMCGNGLTVGTPILTGSDSHVEWTCSNTNGTEKTCKAYQEYCGDGKKNGEEECDGTDFCDSQCKTITPATTCNEVFTGTRRLGDNKPFSDILKANWHDRYLFDKEVEFKENHGDYNNGDDPVFDWTDELVNNGMKVDANKEMTIIKSNPYNIITAPTIRASDNIYIEYTIRYDNVPHTTKPSKSNLYSHKECVYYEISRCGDGTLDKDYGEECDPGSAGTSTLPDGRICNKDCKIESTPQSDGKVKIEKTLKDKKEVSSTGEILTWDVKVWAEGGDVTDFQIKDIVPFALEYKSYKVNKNDDNLTVSDPTGPVKVDTGNVYTWDVKGTLKKDHELLLEVTTEVVLMPTSQDDYRNVACVINDGDEDCDDDKPGEGTRDIKKTLISPKEVTKVGDEIVWSLKLTVSGGVVKNPVITDILPPVLGYSGYLVTHNPGVTISKPTTGTLTSGGQTLEYVRWTTEGTLTNNDYIEIQLTTYIKEMPDEEYKNVLCVKPENEDEKCDDEPVYKPELWIKKTFTDGTKKKTVKIGDEIGYRIDFGNKGKASATVTSIKDFLPKNVKYKTGTIVVNSNSTYNTGTWEKGEEIVNGFNYIEGVRIEIYGGMTLEPNVSGYIILTGEVLNEFTGNTQNWACIYLDDKKIDCDDAIHEIDTGVSCKPTLNPSSFPSVNCSDTSAFTTTVTCSSTGGLADLEIICNGEVINSGHAEQLTGTCTGTANNTDYKVQCKVNGSFTGNAGEVCEGSFRRNCTTPSSCFVAGTKVTMADGTQKNIEDVKIGDKIMGENGINTVLGYDRPVLGERHLWSINGGEYFVSDEHPFKTTEGWKSFNPEMTKLEIDLNTTELKVGDTLVTKIGLEIVETATYMDADYDTPLYNFVLDGDHTYYANGYLVHNKGGDDPYCKAPVLENGVFTCTSTDNVYAIGIDCDHVTGTENVDKEKISDKGREILSVSASCNQNGKVQCYVKKNSTSSWETKPSGCGWEPTNPGSSCFVAGTKVTMSDGSKKNIEDVKIGDKLLGSKGTINTVLGYDRPALGERHLWSINGGEYFVSDEHPFKTTEGWKSFNPEMTKLEIDLNTTKLNLGDKIITENGVEEIKTADYISKDANTQLYNFILDGDHTYHANGYLVHNKGGGSCFVAGTKVVMADGTEKNIEDVKVGEKIMGENGVNTVLGYDRPILRSRHLWSINGGEYFVSDEHPFKTTEGWKSFNPEMTKLEIDLNTTELKVGNILITKNGLEEIKTIDYIDEDYNTPLYNFVLDGDHTYYANGYLVHNKGNTPDPVLYDSAACFNVNTNNISIEQGEILPFFWNINNMKNVKDWATELTGGFKSTVSAVKSDIVKANEGNKCSDDGFIALNSMICSFKITNGNHKTVYEGSFPCLRDAGLKGENWVSDQKLLDAWMTYGKNKYRGDGKYKFFWSFSNKDRSYALRSNLNYIDNFGAGEDVFGEYKLSLTNIEYLQCRNDKWTLVSPKIDHCENNFVLTNPYTVQKTPSGNLRASTTTLDKYLYMDSNDVLQKAGGLLNAIATSEYAPNDTVNKAMSNFINKYQKLAISIKSSNGKTIKKVPGKDIYFVEGNINLGGSDSDVKFSKPVTFVQTKGIATINGSVEGLNMMLLTNGSITFNGLSNCKSRQVVKGIFYAKGGIYRTGVQKNTDLNNSQRCTEGGLTIKGVLIGGGLDGMMKKSRSNFNDWFETTDKKGIVMNGASVLIEYSPSVFTKSTMPPGAEDFTTALNVYKN